MSGSSAAAPPPPRHARLKAQMAAGSPLLLPAQKQALAAATEAPPPAGPRLSPARLCPARRGPSELAAARAHLELLTGQLAGVRRKEQRLLARLAEAEAAAAAFEAVPDGRRRAGQ